MRGALSRGQYRSRKLQPGVRSAPTLPGGTGFGSSLVCLAILAKARPCVLDWLPILSWMRPLAILKGDYHRCFYNSTHSGWHVRATDL